MIKPYVKLWVDDERRPEDWIGPEYREHGWVWATSYDEAVRVLETGFVKAVSLDNDMGLSSLEGYKIVHWMIENDTWPTEKPKVHSANPVANKRMRDDINRYGPYNGN